MRDGVVFIGGRRRTAVVSPAGESYLSHVSATRGMPLARLPAARGKRGLSRRLVWGIAEISGFDPKRWQVEGNCLRTWGGHDFNRLLSIVLMQSKAAEKIIADDFSITSQDWHFIPEPARVRALTVKIRESGRLSARSAGGFREPTRYITQLSKKLQGIETLNAIPFKEGQILIGAINNEPMRVETVRSGGHGVQCAIRTGRVPASRQRVCQGCSMTGTPE